MKNEFEKEKRRKKIKSAGDFINLRKREESAEVKMIKEKRN